MQQLYAAEQQLREQILSAEQRYAFRQAKVIAVMEDLKKVSILASLLYHYCDTAGKTNLAVSQTLHTQVYSKI